MCDLISRQAAIGAVFESAVGKRMLAGHKDLIKILKSLPSAQPEIKPISYQDCSNALLMMWMDNVITDGEYKRISDKLNAKHKAGGE